MHAAEYAAALTERLRNQVDAQPELGRFVEDFWHGVVTEDLIDRAPEDDAQLTWQAWQDLATFDPDEPAIEVSQSALDHRFSVVKILHPDMPFITDSVLMELSRRDLRLRYLHNVTLPVREQATTMVYAEVDALDEAEEQDLLRELGRVLADVRAVVRDHDAMRDKALALALALENQPAPPPHLSDQVDASEAAEFLRWLCNDHFTFLGARSFRFDDGSVVQEIGSELGHLTLRRAATSRPLAELREETLSFLLEPTYLSFSRAGTPSRVHRPAYPDYIGIKRFDAAGKVVGEYGFLGLYTSPVYTMQPTSIPVIRQRVTDVLARSGHKPGSFDYKSLAQILATYPRDALFQSGAEQLFQTATDIAHIHERRMTRVYLWRGRYGLFFNCLVYLPRDLLNTRVRKAIGDLLCERLHAIEFDFDSFFSESRLVRLQYTLRVDPLQEIDVDLSQLQQQIIDLSQDWQEELGRLLRDDPERGALARGFSADYQHHFDVATAVFDAGHLTRLADASQLKLRFYRVDPEQSERVNLKLFRKGELLPLSRVVPILEHLGFDVVSEHPYTVTTETAEYSIQDFSLRRSGGLDLTTVGPAFESAFARIWQGVAQSDRFNGLILCQGLSWREVALLRGYAAYMRQAGFGFEREFIGATLLKHDEAARLLIQHFHHRLGTGAVPDCAPELGAYLDAVPLLNEDQVLRGFMQLIEATERTNFYYPFEHDAGLIVYKLSPENLSALPLPRPRHELFVYAPDMEGVHLRSSSVARGGIRWSDRLEDYRTEILGLVKAQIVKNAVIVPSGAKGGFVIKRDRGDLSGADWQALGERTYRRFISGLLSVTDNLIDDQVVEPPGVRCRDGEDPYFVVAADKGTATFSDIANEVAQSNDFWLGDAFASGGSVGYDHKKLGITARGAWVSVQRHFHRLGIDPESAPVTVIGIGDMAGDVFGNGMLRSSSMRLLAAFNHRHIFIDPTPDVAAAFAERQRLFECRGGWDAYATALISDGGGVFERSAKTIPISASMAAAFAINAAELSPDALITALLCAPVDLLWNGGIGTYVKASGESHQDVGDRANDGLRVNGRQVRARVIGEGGNLGLTHKGRIEYAQHGGLINADFIDNAGGVDCSDHEVNAKILLGAALRSGEVEPDERDALLLSQADAVADRVLANNFVQARCLSLARDHSIGRIDEYDRLAQRLEQELDFTREEADFPSEETLQERQREGESLQGPELATLMSYAKLLLKRQLASTTLHEDPSVAAIAENAFSPEFAQRFDTLIQQHRLLPQIVHTQLTNRIIGIGGITFVDRTMDFSGASVEDVVRSFLVCDRLFELERRMNWLDAAPVDVDHKRAATLDLMRGIRRVCRWLLRLHRYELDIDALLQRYRARIAEALGDDGLTCLGEHEAAAYAAKSVPFADAPMQTNALAQPLLGFELFAPLAVAEVAAAQDMKVKDVAPVYVGVGRALGLEALGRFLGALAAPNHWRAMERDALLDDLCTHQVHMTCQVLEAGVGLDAWLAARPRLVRRTEAALDQVHLDAEEDLAGIAMTVRKLVELAQDTAAD